MHAIVSGWCCFWVIRIIQTTEKPDLESEALNLNCPIAARRSIAPNCAFVENMIPANVVSDCFHG